MESRGETESVSEGAMESGGEIESVSEGATGSGGEAELTRIMVAVNESSIMDYPYPSISSKGAFEWTVKKIVRSNTSSFKLLFLHVQALVRGDDTDDIVENEISGRHMLDFFVNRCHEIGVPCEAWIKYGDPRKVICLEVKRVQPDFLVVGSRGLNCFQKFFIRTVSEYVARHAECPVITVKRKAEETPDPEDPADD